MADWMPLAVIGLVALATIGTVAILLRLPLKMLDHETRIQGIEIRLGTVEGATAKHARQIAGRLGGRPRKTAAPGDGEAAPAAPEDPWDLLKRSAAAGAPPRPNHPGLTLEDVRRRLAARKGAP